VKADVLGVVLVKEEGYSCLEFDRRAIFYFEMASVIGF
jgi:hypothetical protein